MGGSGAGHHPARAQPTPRTADGTSLQEQGGQRDARVALDLGQQGERLVLDLVPAAPPARAQRGERDPRLVTLAQQRGEEHPPQPGTPLLAVPGQHAPSQPEHHQRDHLNRRAGTEHAHEQPQQVAHRQVLTRRAGGPAPP